MRALLLPAALCLAPLVAPCPSAAVESAPVWEGHGNQANANFGYSVATAGDVNGDGFSDIVVGARTYDAGQIDEGRAYVYLGGASGPAGVAAWTGESDQVLAFYASSVAGAGDVNGDGYADLLVGAPSYDATLQNEGRVDLHLGGPTGPAASPSLTWVGGQVTATFGNAVASAGDVNGDGYDDVLVGVRGWDGAEANAGKAVVFHGGAAGPDSLPAWTALGTQDNEAFGWSVAGAGDVNGDGYGDVIVGAFFHDGTLADEGMACVYLGSAAGLDSLPVWTGLGQQQTAGYGWAVAGAGDVNGDGYADVVVGARYHDGSFADEGRAYLYLGSATGVDSLPAWTADGGQAGAFFGWSVGSAGDVNGDGLADVIVGGYRADVTWLDDGVARIYLGRSGGLQVEPAWTGSSAQEGAGFGWSAAAAGDVDGDGFGDVIVGSYFHDDGQPNEGLASVYRGGAEGPAPTPWWKGSAGTGVLAYGFVATYAGDVNGDGFTDVLVSDPLADLSVSGEGRVDLFPGGESGPDTSPTWSTGGSEAGENWGRSAASAGDVNGDGYEDVLIGAPFASGAFPQEGRAALFAGSAVGLSATAAWTAAGGAGSAELGASAAGLGDVNGDGYGDFAIGAPGLAGGTTASGAVFVYYGAGTGAPAFPDVVLGGAQANARFGASVAAAGDVNADGYADLVVGEPLASGGAAEEGRVHVYLGAATGLPSLPDWTVSGDQAGAQLGALVASAGDVDGDGYADILATAPLHDGPGIDEGQVFVYRGGPAGPSTGPDWTWAGGEPGAPLDAAASAGDANADGYGDLLVGVSRFTSAFTLEGRVVFFAGSDSGLAAAPATEWFGGRDFARLGSSLTGRGDPNGNGWPDLLIGARGWTDSSSTGGAAFLFAANVGADSSGAVSGGTIALRQRRSDDTAPIALGGVSDSENAFRLRTGAGSAGGRTRVRLQWEAKPLGVPFDGIGTGETSWFDTGVPQSGSGSRVEIDALASGLAAGRSYRWRVRTLSAQPRFPGSPWFSPPGNGRTETDLRTPGTAVRVSEPVVAASRALSLAAAPTPFRTSTVLSFTLPQPGPVSLRIHDVSGRVVAVLLDGALGAGEQRAVWDGRNRGSRLVAPGVYWARLTAAGGEGAVRVVRLR